MPLHAEDEPLVQRYEPSDPRLGRHIHLDARSLLGARRFENTADLIRRKVHSITHVRRVPILDQARIGSCTGNAAVGGLGTEGSWYRPEIGRLSATDAEALAVSLYSAFTAADPYPGEYPPDDTGSDGLTVCKVLKDQHLVMGYRTITSLRGLALALQDGPVLAGFPWYDRFFEPTSDGRIDPRGWGDSEVAGGHEFIIRGVLLNEVEPSNLDAALFLADNSWGTSWGPMRGSFTFCGRTYRILKGEVDLYQPRFEEIPA